MVDWDRPLCRRLTERLPPSIGYVTLRLHLARADDSAAQRQQPRQDRYVLVCTGAGGENGIAKLSSHREISVSSLL
jgi:hypothetical protein